MHQEIANLKWKSSSAELISTLKYATRYNCGLYFTMFSLRHRVYMICACTCEFTNSNYHISSSRPRLEWKSRSEKIL